MGRDSVAVPVPIEDVRGFILSYIDPLFAKQVLDGTAVRPAEATKLDPILFGTHLDRRVHVWFLQLVADALAPPFIDLLIDVLNATGAIRHPSQAEVLRASAASLAIVPVEPGLKGDPVGAINAGAAITDLLMQPLTALGTMVSAHVANWARIADTPDLATSVFYLTNQSTEFAVVIEQRVRQELGLKIDLTGGGDGIVNFP
jgi:hypothetical protein